MDFQYKAMNDKVKVKKGSETYELETKDALLIEAIRELTSAVRSIKW